MENRELILKDYFELQNILNRANKLKNEVSTFVFISEFDAGTGRVFAKANNARLLICVKRSMEKWREEDSSPVPHLKRYITEILNQKIQMTSSSNSCDDLIKRSIHELLNYQSTDF